MPQRIVHITPPKSDAAGIWGGISAGGCTARSGHSLLDAAFAGPFYQIERPPRFCGAAL